MTQAVAAKTRPLDNARHIALALPWLGQFFAITPIYTILLQVQVSETVRHNVQNSAVGLATGLGGFFALVLPPLVGAWSDGLTSRFGRRRPFLVAGTFGLIGACLVMLSARSYPLLLIGFVAVVATVNVAGAATFGLVPDIVRGDETGKASGLLNGMSQLGSVTSLLAVLLMARAGNIRNTYSAIIAVLVITLVPVLWAAAGEGLEPVASRRRQTLAQFLAPLFRGDFGWSFFTRLMTISGVFTVLPFLVFAFRDVQGIKDAANFTALFELILTAVAVPCAIVGGLLSDRYGRKRFVYASGAIFATVLLLFLFALGRMSAPLILGLGVVYGVGSGCWGAVDWALGLDTLPGRARAAKDLGLYHVADSLPRVIVPPVAGFLVDFFNRLGSNLGYRAIFLLAILFSVAGAVFVTRIRSVR